MAVFLVLGSSPVWAESMPSPEYQLKASFVYHFTKFIKWPQDKLESGNGTLSICVLGRDPFGKALDAIGGKKSHGARIEIYRIKESTARECHIVFVNESDAAREKALIELVAKPGVLVLGESEDFIRNGGMMRFLTVDDRVRFQINEKAAKAAGLEIPKKLMSVAVPL